MAVRSLFQRHLTINGKRQMGINFFGVRQRRDRSRYVNQLSPGCPVSPPGLPREYLFLELEPAYNRRKENEDANRQFAWNIPAPGDRAAADLRRVKNRKAPSARR